jgi:hypothetical protein
MSVEVDRELELWRAEWQAVQPPPDRAAALRRRVVRRSRGLVLGAVLEAAVALAGCAALAWIAGRHRAPLDVAFALGLGLLFVGLLAAVHWNRRGVWRPAAATTRAFLDLSILRCRRRLRGVRLGLWALLVEDALLAPWLAHRLAARAAAGEAIGVRNYLFGYGLLAALSLAVLAYSAAVAGYTRRELPRLEALRDALEPEGEPEGVAIEP